MLAALVIVDVAEIKPPVSTLPPVTFPVTLDEVPVITPPTTLAAVAVPVTDTLEPVITPPTTEAAVVVPVTEVLEPVITPPTTLAAVTAPDTDTTEPSKLEPVTVPLALSKPVMYSPVVANTTTFDVPPIETLALPPLAPIATVLVPLTMLLTVTAPALMLEINPPSPTKKPAVDMLPVALIMPFDTMVLAVITLAVLKILVQELVELEYWYDT